MGERNPIFGKDSTQIGYVEGGEAFDLSGRKPRRRRWEFCETQPSGDTNCSGKSGNSREIPYTRNREFGVANREIKSENSELTHAACGHVREPRRLSKATSIKHQKDQKQPSP